MIENGELFAIDWKQGLGIFSEAACPYVFASNGVTSAGGIMVSIAAFQAVDPGSIPGQRR